MDSSDSRTTRDDEELEPIQGRKVYDPETGTWIVVEEAVTERMDTMVWREIPTTDDPPITSTGEVPVVTSPSNVLGVTEFGSQLLSTYNVSLVLPFLTDRFSEFDASIYANSLWAINFYAGVKMALDVLADEQVNLDVSVMDSGASAQVVTNLINSNDNLGKAHLIIGPYRRENVALMAQFARQRGSVLVSPHSAASGISTNNPNYVQTNPTLASHSAAILRHALSRYRPQDIVLVSKSEPNEVGRLAYFRSEYNLINRGVLRATPLRELIIEDQSAALNRVSVDSYLGQGDTTVFIVPDWDETFVYALLRKIDVSRDPYETVVVYGMPQWRDFEKIDFDYYEKLNVHISSGHYVDPLSAEVRLFKQQFYDRYGSIPRDEAFVGYDVMLYFGRMLKRYGTKFQYALEGNEADMLHTRYYIERVVPVTTTSGIETDIIDQFANKFVNILEFENYQFQKSN